MSDMTSTSNKSRQQVSHEQDLQNTFVLCNIVANVAVVIADAELRQRQLRRTSTSNIIREFRVRKRRFVEDIYKELGPVGHIECDTVTSRHWLMSFVHTLYQQLAGKKDVHPDLFQMDQFYQMSALHVRCDGSLLLHHMTS
jgi:hypothetical protein